jgi:hypothetical protein
MNLQSRPVILTLISEDRPEGLKGWVISHQHIPEIVAGLMA